MKINKIYKIIILTDNGEKVLEFEGGIHFKKYPKITIKDGVKIKVVQTIIT